MSRKPPPIRSAFRRAIRLGLLWPVLGLLLVFAVAGIVVVGEVDRASTGTQARAFASWLELGSPKEVAEAIGRLLSGQQALLAVALADADNTVVAIQPDRPELREVARAALSSDEPVGSHLRINGRREGVTAVAAALTREGFRGQRCVFVFRSRPLSMELWTAMAAMAVFAAVAIKVSSDVLLRWFDGKVQRPVEELCRLAGDRNEIASRADGNGRDASPELAGTPAEFHSILNHLVDAERRLRRIEREAERQLRDQEAGLGRKLRRAEDLATTDALTGLRNRAYFDREFSAIVRTQKERKHNLAVVMIDVDNFKELNDTKGHQAGDDVLRFVGDLLGGSVRPTDHAIRYAGDEFVLLLLDVDETQARSVVERIVRLFAQYANTLNVAKPPSLSAGLATLADQSAADPVALLAAADSALYRVKRGGKNAVAVGPGAPVQAVASRC